jgi:enoyl-CoA hydratase/carnithine racemase
MSEHVVCTIDDPVAVIRLNRPDNLNALDAAMLGTLRDSVRRAEHDPAVVGIIITGTGRGFCSGWDAESLVSEVGADSQYRHLREQDPTPDWFSFLLHTTKPVIAAVNGVAAATGFVLALMADLRFADPTARFTTAFSRRGLVAEHGSSWLLPRLIGPSKALDLLLTARMVDANEAVRIGLVDRIAAHNVVDEASDYIRALAENCSPSALRETKRLVYRHLGDHDHAIREAWNTMADSFDRTDPTEGMTAFVNRRPPRFPRVGDTQTSTPGKL